MKHIVLHKVTDELTGNGEHWTGLSSAMGWSLWVAISMALFVFLILFSMRNFNARLKVLESQVQDIDAKENAKRRSAVELPGVAPKKEKPIEANLESNNIIDVSILRDLSEFGLVLPLAQVAVPQNPDLLPGAPRKYRAGIHEGIDFFAATGTPVGASADGFITWLDKSYEEPSSGFRNYLLSQSKSLGETPCDALRLLEGRKVIINHGLFKNRLLTTEYAHLNTVAPGIAIGTFVTRGQTIGFVGSSGTSHRVGGSHLHFEIRTDSEPLGLGLDPDSLYKLLTNILHPEMEELPKRSQDKHQLKGRLLR